MAFFGSDTVFRGTIFLGTKSAQVPGERGVCRVPTAVLQLSLVHQVDQFLTVRNIYEIHWDDKSRLIH